MGQLSELVRSPFGWHILRVEDKHEAAIKPLAEVEQEVRDKLRQDKARDAVAAFVDDLLTALEANPQQFAALAQQHELEVVTTPFIAATGQADRMHSIDHRHRIQQVGLPGAWAATAHVARRRRATVDPHHGRAGSPAAAASLVVADQDARYVGDVAEACVAQPHVV